MDFKEHIEEEYGLKVANDLLNALNRTSSHALLLNTEKISIEDFQKQFPHIKNHPYIPNAFLYDKNEYDLGKSIYHDAGAIYISDASALMVAYVLNANKDDVVLDMCAAPGGKSIQTSILMQNAGVIVANDLSYNRALVLSQNVERTGRKNIVVISNDLSKNRFPMNSFSKIILDAPCSGSGMFRKENKMLDDWSIEKVKKQAEIQKKLIDLAYSYLCEGGELIYSTCSFSKEENFMVVSYLLNKYDDIHVVSLTNYKNVSLTPINEGITLSYSSFCGEGQYFCLLKKDGKMPILNAINEDYIKEIQFKNLNLKGKLIKKNDALYLSPTNINLTKFNVVRNGLKLGEQIKDNFIPDYHLSHFLPSTTSIVLSYEEAKKYLHGDTINLDVSKGFHLVSYLGLNLGFVKASNGQLKNHYPKGLRHN